MWLNNLILWSKVLNETQPKIFVVLANSSFVQVKALKLETRDSNSSCVQYVDALPANEGMPKLELTK